MKKQQLIDKIEHAWKDFKESYVGLSAEVMIEPEISGEWSVKELVAHVSAWEGEALKYLPLILQGKRPPRYSVLYGGIDAFNAQTAAQARQLSLDEIIQQADETHTRLLAYLQVVPEEEFESETRFRRRIRLDTYSHYPIHTQAIWDWHLTVNRKTFL